VSRKAFAAVSALPPSPPDDDVLSFEPESESDPPPHPTAR
jgi:hypothetical protein